MSTTSANILFSPGVLVFEANNYNQPQYVYLQSSSSAQAGLTYTADIVHTVSSGDQNYNGITPLPKGTITVTVIHPCKAGMLAYPPGKGICTLCPLGYSCKTLYEDKVACETTEFSPDGEWNCLPCPAGHSCDGASMPVPCAFGYTAAAGDGICTQCVSAPCDLHGHLLVSAPSGSYVFDDGHSIHSCPAGHYCSGGSAQPVQCSTGEYAPVGSSGCTECPPGFFCPFKSLSQPIPCDPHSYSDQYGATFCTVCEPGNSCTSTGSTACGMDQMSLEGWMQCLECDGYCVATTGSCALGEYYDGTACQTCDEGYQCDGVRKKPCPPGHYSTAGASLCSQCNLGTYNNEVAQNACKTVTTDQYIVNQPRIGEWPCPRGTEPNSDDTGCVSCTAGYNCDDPTTPEPCSDNHYCFPVPLTQSSYNTETYCPDGFTLSVSMAWVVTQSDQISDCIPSVAGKYSVRSLKLSECPKGHICPEYTKILDAFPCPQGTFSSAADQDQQTDCSDCSVGYYCPEGGQSAQRNCVKGTYCEIKSFYPTSCPPGKTSPKNSIQSADCVDCTAGNYCPGGTPELKCPVGTFNTATQGTFTWDSCTYCTAGFSCSQSGQTAGNTFTCAKGHVCLTGTQYPDQFPCRAGTESDNTDNVDFSSCAACTLGYFCPVGSTLSDKQFCPRGHYCLAGTKFSHQSTCAAGTYSWTIQNDESTDCTQCPAGYFCARGSQIISGYCGAGNYCLAGTTLPYQTECAAGTYSNNQDNTLNTDCTACPVGSFCWSGSSEPIECPKGTYRNSASATQPSDCATCSAGSYCPEGSSSETQCEAGYMSAAGAWECEICPAGSQCDAGTDGASPPNCSQGYYCPQGSSTTSRIECPVGHYCLQSSTVPTPCEAGTYRASTGATSQSDCQNSTEGYYTIEGSEGDTGLCEPGYFCVEGSKGPYNEPCEAGKYRRSPGAASSSDCATCDAGYYCLLGTAEPIICPAGYYCPAGSDWPTLCPKGKVGEGEGLTAETECTDCPDGAYCSQTGLLVADGYCTQGYLCDEGSSSGTPSASECTPGGYCEPGFPTKRACPPGTYNDQSGAKDSSWCKPCTAGFFCKGDEDDISSNICLAGYYCPVNSYWQKQNIAPPGTYTQAQAWTTVTCSSPTFNRLYAQSSCTDCTQGYYCPNDEMTEPIPCYEGYYCQVSTTTPEACSQGTYNPRKTAISSDQCYDCPPGYYCPTAGIDTFSDLVQCDPGYWCIQGAYQLQPSSEFADVMGPCPAGHYCLQGSPQEIPCESGKYNPDTLGTSDANCLDCPGGKYCTNTGSSAEGGDCYEGYYCQAGTRVPRPPEASEKNYCQAGQKCETGSEEPADCSAGTYQNKDRQSSCDTCPAGYYCPAGTSNFNDNPCKIGYYCPQGTEYDIQYACPLGTYNPRQRATQIEDCIDCTPGSYCGSTALSAPSGLCSIGYFCKIGSILQQPPSDYPGDDTGGKCIQGTYCPGGSVFAFECDGGKYCDQEELGAVSGDCSAGYYCIGGATTSTPTDGVTGDICPQGHYCQAGSITPIPCPPGTYNDQEGKTQSSDCKICNECDSCLGGVYCAGSGLSEFTGYCAEGYYCPLDDGAGNPVYNFEERPKSYKCGQGSYCPEGSYQITQCAINTYQWRTLQGECLDCPQGYACLSPGTIEPDLCQAGHYCPGGDQGEIDCEEGTYSNVLGRWDSGQCVDCPPGKYCSGTGLTAPTGDCDGGFTCEGGATAAQPGADDDWGQVCPIGYYCPVGSGQRIPCTPGKYCETEQLTAPTGDCQEGYYCEEQSDDKQSEKCPRGYYCGPGSYEPTPCPVGKYQPDEFKTLSTDCIDCNAGMYCDTKAARDASGLCSAGYYCPTGSVTSTPPATVCQPGYYCPTGSSIQIECPEGTYQDQQGQSTCKTCPAGFYCDTNTITPTQCTAGYQCPEGTTPSSQDPCGNGSYQPFAGQSSCIECPPGTQCGTGPLTVTTPCEVPRYCPAGTSIGTLCPSGTYTDETGLQNKDQCKECVTGHYCLSGVDQGQCDPGYLCESGSNTNTPDSFTNTGTAGPCPEGHYCLIGSTLPTPCPSGKFRESTGGATEADCTDCTAGYYCIANNPIPVSCPIGYYCQAAVDKPEPCPAGTYSKTIRATSSATCLTCPEGYRCYGTGIGNYEYWPCTPGYYCPEGTLELIESTVGNYSPDEYAGSTDDLLSCPQGYFCELTETGYQVCQSGTYCAGGNSQQVSCPARYYCENSVSVGTICPAGWYCPSTNSIADGEEAPPIKCGEGAICPEGSSSEQSCTAGFIALKARAISIQEDDDFTPQCIPCDPGTYSDGDNIECLICDEGYVCEGESSSPTPSENQNGYECPVGTYCPAGSIQPQYCQPGTYSNTTAIGSENLCLQCPANTYTDLPMQNECKPCGENAQSSIGSTTCTPKGRNRRYMKEFQESICRTGYVYLSESGADESDQDSDQDCSPKVYQRCAEGEVRNIKGECINPDSTGGLCEGQGKTQPGIGIPICDIVDDLSVNCNGNCRDQALQIEYNELTGFNVYDPTTGQTELVSTENMENFSGSIGCLAGQSCKVRGVDMIRESRSIGVFGATGNLENYLSNRRRLQDDVSMANITDPIMCLELGETMIFDVSPDNYPVYIEDSILNSNLEFDYSAFQQLSNDLANGENIEIFAFTFTEGGVYLFENSGNSDSVLVISVMSDQTECPFDSGPIQPRTEASIHLIGAKLDGDIILQVNWLVVFILLLCLFMAVVIFTMFFYYYASMTWQISGYKTVPYRKQNMKMQIQGDVGNKTTMQVVIDGKEAHSSGSEAEQLVDMIFEAQPELVNYEPTAQLDDQDSAVSNDLIKDIRNQIRDNNKRVIEALDANAADSQERIQALANQTDDLRNLLQKLLNPLEGFMTRPIEVGAYEEAEKESELEISSLGFAHQIQEALDDIADNSVLIESDKQKLINQLNSEFKKLEANLKGDRSEKDTALAKKLQERKKRREELQRQKKLLEKEEKELEKTHQNQIWNINVQAEQEEKVIDEESEQEKQQIIEEVMGDPVRELKDRLQQKIASSPERSQEFMKQYEKDLENLEQHMSINQIKQKQDLMKRLEQRRNARKKEIRSRVKQEQTNIRTQQAFENQKLQQKKKELEVEEAVQQALHQAEEIPQEDKLVQLQEKQKKEIQQIQRQLREEEDKEVHSLTRKYTADENKLATRKNMLEKQRQSLLDTINKASTTDAERIINTLKQTEQKLAMIAQQQSQEQKKNLEERLEIRRRKREERLREVKARHEQQEKQLEQQQKQADDAKKTEKLQQAINTALGKLPAQDQNEAIKALLQSKHTEEKAKLQEKLKKRMRKNQKELIQEILKRKANDLEALRQEYRDRTRAAGRDPDALSEVQKQENQAINRLDYYYMKELESAQEKLWRANQQHNQNELLALVDAQLVQMRSYLKHDSGNEEMQNELERKLQQEKAQIQEEGKRKMEQLDSKRVELQKLKEEKHRELQEMIQKERAREEMARKREDLLKQKRELEEKQRKKREELEKRGNMTAEEMERLIKEYQKELQLLDNALSRERERQMAMLGSKLAEKREQKLEYDSSVQKMKEAQDKWQKEMDELPGITHKQATTLLLKWRRYPKRHLKEVERSIKTQEPRERPAQIVPVKEGEDKFVKLQDSKLDELMQRVKKIEGIVANVDVHQFSSISHALETLERSLKTIKQRQ